MQLKPCLLLAELQPCLNVMGMLLSNTDRTSHTKECLINTTHFYNNIKKYKKIQTKKIRIVVEWEYGTKHKED